MIKALYAKKQMDTIMEEMTNGRKEQNKNVRMLIIYPFYYMSFARSQVFTMDRN